MKILLDTQAYSDWKRGHSGIDGLVRRAQRIYFSPVVAGELVYGFRLGARYDRNVREFEGFLASVYVELTPVSMTTVERYGRIAAGLRRKGRPIPTNDIWIAAAAMETGAELISEDSHFAEIDGLVWRVPPADRGLN